jgi:hypothetical protein
LAKGGIWCFYESLVLYPNFVLPMKFSARKPALRQSANRWALRFARTALTENDQFCRMKIQIFDTPTFTVLAKIRLIFGQF